MYNVKKNVKIVALILLCLILFSLIQNVISKIQNDLTWEDEIEIENDDMLGDGTFMLCVNQTAARKYITSTSSTSSKNELEEMYLKFCETYSITYNDITDDVMKIYIKLQNENAKSMYLYGIAYFNEDGEMTRISFSFYDGSTIFTAYNTGTATFDITAKFFKGTTLNVVSGCVIAIEGVIDGETKYFDLSQIYENKNIIHTTCSSIFTDLFVVREYIASDDNTDTETTVSSIDLDYLDRLYAGEILWDTDAYGDTPISDYYSYLYDSSLESEGALEIQSYLVFNYNCINQTTLDSFEYFFIISTDMKKLAIVKNADNTYTTLYYQGLDYLEVETRYVSDDVYVDLSNYRLEDEQTLLVKHLLNFNVEEPALFSDSTQLISGVREETDLPVDFNHFFYGYSE